MGFLQLEEENFCDLKIFQSWYSSSQDEAKGIRIGISIVINYLILNEIISSTIVYDQDANHSMRFTLAEFGGSLNFIAICFNQYFLFVDIWTFTWNSFRIFKKTKT